VDLTATYIQALGPDSCKV